PLSLRSPVPVLFCVRLTRARISPLSLHDALPIWTSSEKSVGRGTSTQGIGSRLLRFPCRLRTSRSPDGSVGRRIHRRTTVESKEARKSRRLNSSHDQVSYAVFSFKQITRIT